MSNAIITVNNLVKKYGDFEAVKGVSFEVMEGEIRAAGTKWRRQDHHAGDTGNPAQKNIGHRNSRWQGPGQRTTGHKERDRRAATGCGLLPKPEPETDNRPLLRPL